MRSGVAGVDAERLARAMDQEAGLLEEFSREQEKLLGTVRSRSWTELESTLGVLQALEGRVQAAEQARLDALPGAEKDAASFAGMVKGLDVPSRLQLERSYHALSLAVLRVRGTLSRLDHYVGSVMGSLNAVLGELLPYRKGRIYCSKGHQREAAPAPFIVDRKQ